MSVNPLALEVPLHRHKFSTSQMFLDANRIPNVNKTTFETQLEENGSFVL